MALFDPFGLELPTTSAESAAAFNSGLTRLLQQQAGAGDAFRSALVHDPEFALASIALGVALRAEAQMKAGTDAFAAAARLHLDERSSSLLAGVVVQTRLQFDEADTAFDEHLAKWPTDVLALSLRLAILNVFSSRADRDEEMLRMVRRVIPFFGDDPFPLSALAFALEENREFDAAHDVATEAVGRMPNNARAAHAVAHTYFETGRLEDGEAFLKQWLDEWEHPGPFACHLGWHRGLSALTRSDRVGARAGLDVVVGFAGRSLAAAADGSSLAWRLRLDGDGDALPWQALVDLPDVPGNRFGNAHRAMTLAGIGDLVGLADYAQVLTELGGHNLLTATWARSLHSFCSGRMSDAADTLDELAPDVRRLGASQAQTDVFRETHIRALQGAGRTGEARRMLEARFRQRFAQRDEDWLTEVA